jgi:hypothetical protein
MASRPVLGLGPTTALSTHVGIHLGVSVMPGISPGTTRRVLLTASNPGSSTVAITRVRLMSVSTDADHPTCVTGDFTMADVAQDASVPAHAHNFPLTGGTLAYRNTDVDQNACQGVTLTLTLSSR